MKELLNKRFWLKKQKPNQISITVYIWIKGLLDKKLQPKSSAKGLEDQSNLNNSMDFDK